MGRKFLNDVLQSHERIFSALQSLEADLLMVLRDVEEMYKKEVSVIRHHLDIFLRIYEKELQLHFRVEEEAIFPYIRERGIVEELVKEHVAIVKEMDRLKEKREADPYGALSILENIIVMLKNHVVKENKLYAEMNEYLTIKEMHEIRSKIKGIYDEEDGS